MDALADYGSDDESSEASSSYDKANASPTATTTAATTSMTSLLPCPDFAGKSAWIHGHKNHLLDYFADCSASSEVKILSQYTKTTGSSSSKPSLASQLRRQKDFFNPKQMEQTVETYGITDPFQNSSMQEHYVQMADWESNVLSLEEQVRDAHASRAAAVASGQATASDFVQDQISRALLGHSRHSS